jgi:hypothetical protein
MNISYTRLFEVSVLHDYFRDGIAKDIRLIPTQETAETFKKGRLICRETPSSTVVFYRSEIDRISPEVALAPPLDLFFLIQSQAITQFLAVTSLSKGSRPYQSGDLLAFASNPANASENPETPERIGLDIWDGMRPKSFLIRVNLPSLPAKVILQVKDASGTKIPSGRDQAGASLPLDLELSPDDKGEFLLSIDLSGKAEGNYSVILRNEANTQDLWKKEYFITQDQNAKSAFGVLKISYRNLPDRLYGPQEYYAIDFKRKATKWTYYIVSQNKKVDLGTAQLSIQDKGNPPGSPYATYTFQQIGTAPNADVKVNNAETVIFKSLVPIPFFESPKLNLELRRKPGNRVLFGHLPNPSRTGTVKVNPGEEISEIYVFI